MPVYESLCPCGHKTEFYARHATDANPPCESCGAPTERMHSRFNPSWLKSISDYNEKGIPGHAQIDGGHIAYRVRSSRNPDGSPEAVRITTRQEQMEYCRAEGLEDPADLNPHLEVSDDGTSASFYGKKGSWGQPFTDPFAPAPASLLDWDAK